ncbi:MAG: hypothetical protein VKK07_07695 [Merismopediaceae bacterium]|nr:hypothetical protein [Merismopediaceae bacterium]
MSNLEGPRFYDLFRKVASIEKRVTRLEDGYHQLDNTLDPEGWIGEAFKLQEEDLEAIKTDIKTLDSKLDIILTHLTGLNKSTGD